MAGKSALSEALKWRNRYPIVDHLHEDDLEMRAAINEHHHKMPRAQAEERAHADYRRDQIVDAAAHHYVGMQAANAAKNMKGAKKHGVMYALALRQLGHKDLVTPPDEVLTRAKNTPSLEIGNFKAHKGDAFSMPPEPEEEHDAKEKK